MLPFFSSKKNFFIIGSMPADVPERIDVLDVGATASKYALRIPCTATVFASACHFSEV